MTAPNHALPLGAVPVVPPQFPRSEEDTSPTYVWSYRAAMKVEMRRWLIDRLKHLDANTPQVAARRAAEVRAVQEMRRPLRLAERLLLATAVRDVLFSKQVQRRAEAQQR